MTMEEFAEILGNVAHVEWEVAFEWGCSTCAVHRSSRKMSLLVAWAELLQVYVDHPPGAEGPGRHTLKVCMEVVGGDS